MNIKAVETFYELLGHRKQTEIRALKLDKDFKPLPKETKIFFVSSKEEFVSKVQELNGEYNLYVGLNERTEGGTDAKDVLSVKRIFVDVDCKQKPASDEDLKEAEKTTDEIISAIETQTELRPTKIYSGNGYQLIYCIPKIEITDDNREEVQNKIQQFLRNLIKKYSNEKVKLDNVGDLPRIIRVTGTTNIKGGKTSEFVEVHTEENLKLKDYILNLKPEVTQSMVGEFEVCNLDHIPLYQIQKMLEYIPSDEYHTWIAVLLALKDYSTKNQIDTFPLFDKWSSKSPKYSGTDTTRKKWDSFDVQSERESKITMGSLFFLAKQNGWVVSTEKNPFKKLHYATQHLICFNELNSLLSLYGEHYLPIKKARWYQLLGGVLQKPIILGEKYTDTRLNCFYPLPTEQGKNDLIYLFKNILSKIKLTIEEPISYHPEQLIGKVIEVIQDNPKEGCKPKKIKVKIENRGYFNADFIEIDEANILIFNKDEQTQQAREYISKALNPIGRNEVVKKLVDDLPQERVSYCPKCTITAYFQPFKKIEELLFLQGFLRRFLIPVGKIDPFLNYGNEEDFKRKISPSGISKQKCEEEIIAFLGRVKQNIANKDFVFTRDAIEKINYYHQFLIAEGQTHSERIANLTKLNKWTFQEYLVKMSCILAGSFNQNVVNEKFVALAYMDLVELLQSTFDFIQRQVWGNFDYGVGWQGATYKERLCLEHLYNTKSLSAESSSISIFDFISYIETIYEVKETRARQIFADFKKKNLVDSKQTDKNVTKVWLTFVPQTEKMVFQGDKGDKANSLYENVFFSINSILNILNSMSPLSPLLPSEQICLKCGNKFPLEYLIFLDGEYFCHSCYEKIIAMEVIEHERK